MRRLMLVAFFVVALQQRAVARAGCYEAFTSNFVCHGYENCGYTCLDGWCAFDGRRGCLCDCNLCSNYYANKVFDAATARCIFQVSVNTPMTLVSGDLISNKATAGAVQIGFTAPSGIMQNEMITISTPFNFFADRVSSAARGTSSLVCGTSSCGSAFVGNVSVVNTAATSTATGFGRVFIIVAGSSIPANVQVTLTLGAGTFITGSSQAAGNVSLSTSRDAASEPTASQPIGGQVTQGAFGIAKIDRVIGKYPVSATFSFVPSAGGSVVSAVTLTYPRNYFASTSTPAAQLSGTLIPGVPGTTSIVLRSQNAPLVLASEAVIITLTGLKMGVDPSWGGAVTISTDADPLVSERIESGVIGGSVSSVTFKIADIDRIADKVNSKAVFTFSPTYGGWGATSVTLNYPMGFFNPSATPSAWLPSGSTPFSVQQPGSTSIVLVTNGPAISTINDVCTITLVGLTMGSVNFGGSITVSTDADQLTSPAVSSGAICDANGCPQNTPISVSPIFTRDMKPEIPTSSIIMNTQQSLVSAIKWIQRVRSTALAATDICMQRSSCETQSLNNECGSSLSKCTSQERSIYYSHIEALRNHISEHSAILSALTSVLDYLSTLKSPMFCHLTHVTTLATQSLQQTISVYHSCIFAIQSRSSPDQYLLNSPQEDPLLQAILEGGSLDELFIAQKAAENLVATVAIL